MIGDKRPEATLGSYLSDFVFGGIDGAVTTFAVVAGVTGASLSPAIVLILGFANLFADGFSMAVGNYLSTKSRKEFAEKIRKSEEHSVHTTPEEEREEIREILSAKGFTGRHLEEAVDIITGDKEVWVDMMMKDEFGIFEDHTSPFRSGIVTFVSFNIIGFIPLMAYVLAYFIPVISGRTFELSVALTSAALFIVGSVKARVVDEKWYTAGAETFLVGGLAALIAYIVGYLLRGLA